MKSDDSPAHKRDPPEHDYDARLSQATTSAERLRALEANISRGRLALVVLAIATFAVGYDTQWFSPWSALAPIAAFVALIVRHDRTIRQRRRQERAAGLYQRALGRLRDDWIGAGNPGDAWRSAEHPYADDLDIFGRGSLFEYLCTARTRAGEQLLAEWLAEPSAPTAIRSRQEAIVELSDRLEFREDLGVLGEELRIGLEPDALIAWAEGEPMAVAAWQRVAPPLLVAASILTAGAWSAGFAGPLPFLLAAAVQGSFALALRRRVHAVITDVQRPSRDLALLADTLARIEAERFQTPRLAELRATLAVHGAPPSAQIDDLRRRVDRLDARKNELFAPISALLLWGTQCALSIESWRLQCARAVPQWIAVVAEIEALNALASFRFEHPDYNFPQIVDGPAHFSGIGVGHPLLPRKGCVTNDVALGSAQRVLLVSGSNMSGKSTLLRAVGINTVLAQAGAPVRATSLCLSPLAVGASLRIVDSLQTGTSHFYAEVKRLRQILDLTDGATPVLFLLDEILHGTNSHDRRIGAAAVVRELARREAIGLVTTHDLALAEIAEDNASGATNVHFEDHMENGVMTFDYKMQPGIVTKSNALALMRSVGLKV